MERRIDADDTKRDIAAVAVLIRSPETREPRLLMLRRHSKEDSYPRFWGIVAGARKQGERITAAAMWETREEAGLTQRSPVLLFSAIGNAHGYNFIKRKVSGVASNKCAYFFVCPTELTLEQITLSAEHEEKEALSLDEIRKIKGHIPISSGIDLQNLAPTALMLFTYQQLFEALDRAFELMAARRGSLHG